MAPIKLSRRQIMRLIGGQSAVLSGTFVIKPVCAAHRQIDPFSRQTPAEHAAGVTPVDKSYQPLNVMRYGALGNGADNDAEAFKTAVAVASVGGGAIYVPGGRKFVSDANIDVTASNVSFFGDGLSSIIHFPDASHRYSGITFSGRPNSRISGAQVENLQLIGGGFPGPSGSGISTNYCDNVRIYGVTSHEWSDNAFGCQGGSNLQIHNCTAYNTGQGISIFQPSDNVIINGNIIYNVLLYDGIDVEGGKIPNIYAVVSNLAGDGSTGPTQGINIEDTSSASVTGNVVHTVANGCGIHLFGAPFSSVTGNVACNAAKSKTYSSGFGIYLGANSGGSSVVGNTTHNNAFGSMKLTDDRTATSRRVMVGINNFNEGPVIQSGNVSLLNAQGADDTTRGDFADALEVVGTTSAGMAYYTKRVGRYTIADDLVYFYIEVGWGAHNGAGDIQIHGLPFPSSNVGHYPVTLRIDGLPIGAGNVPMGAVNPSAITIGLSQWTPSSGELSGIPLAASCKELAISGFYSMRESS
jgi:hypothetical protein